MTQRVKIQSVNFFMLLFGNESLTSFAFINIRHKLTGWQEPGNCSLCYVIGQCLACYRRHQKCMNRVGSVASLTLVFFIIQYFLINKGISVTSDIKICFCPASLTILVENVFFEVQTCTKLITHFFSLVFFSPPPSPQVIWRWGGCITLTWSEPYV